MKEASLQRVQTILFILHPRKSKIIGTKNRSVVTRVGDEGSFCAQGGARGNCGVGSDLCLVNSGNYKRLNGNSEVTITDTKS